eukprot:TRINITY_DN5488_c0_g1_i1.p3 TRINITY_DN5488_c0_g1~~TRINITY_DN5488_c0_g1_i1.p3  ORF type:complete len:93 (-),score=19.97 TRINITY_DN5488_c0_g1_i1:70-348(-)
MKERYIEIATSTMLYMKDPRSRNKYKDYVVPELLTYLDFFVGTAPDLNKTVLDKCSVGNATIRSVYINTYGEKGMWSTFDIKSQQEDDDYKQ